MACLRWSEAQEGPLDEAPRGNDPGLPRGRLYGVLVGALEFFGEPVDLGGRETSVPAQGRQEREPALLGPSRNGFRGDVQLLRDFGCSKEPFSAWHDFTPSGQRPAL